jgi:hypothetical protein
VFVSTSDLGLHPTFGLVFLVPPSFLLIICICHGVMASSLFVCLFVFVYQSLSLSLWLYLCMYLGHVLLTYKQTVLPEISLVEMCHDAEVRSPSWM